MRKAKIVSREVTGFGMLYDCSHPDRKPVSTTAGRLAACAADCQSIADTSAIPEMLDLLIETAPEDCYAKEEGDNCLHCRYQRILGKVSGVARRIK